MARDFIVAALALGFGLATLAIRVVQPDAFAKLAPLRKRFGAGLGTAIHWLAYTIMPLVAGAAMLARALSVDN
jgi:hypothetical protein